MPPTTPLTRTAAEGYDQLLEPLLPEDEDEDEDEEDEEDDDELLLLLHLPEDRFALRVVTCVARERSRRDA